MTLKREAKLAMKFNPETLNKYLLNATSFCNFYNIYVKGNMTGERTDNFIWRSWRSPVRHAEIRQRKRHEEVSRSTPEKETILFLLSVPNRGISPEPYYPCEKFTVSKSTAIRLFRARLYRPVYSPVFHVGLGSTFP